MLNLLITGGCGFIGSNFINHIFYKNQEIKIINFDALYYCASKENVNIEIRESNRYILVEGNLIGNKCKLIKEFFNELFCFFIYSLKIKFHLNNHKLKKRKLILMKLSKRLLTHSN